MIEDFTNPGNPGEIYGQVLSELKDKLCIKTGCSEFGIQSLVNSFYHCVNSFPHAKIVFWTFGNDGKSVFDEFN